jgi:hypothetical protein
MIARTRTTNGRCHLIISIDGDRSVMSGDEPRRAGPAGDAAREDMPFIVECLIARAALHEHLQKCLKNRVLK